MARKGNEPPEKRGGSVSPANVDNAVGVAPGSRGGRKYASMSLQGARRALLWREVNMHYESDGDDDGSDFNGIVTDVTRNESGNLRVRLSGAEGSYHKEYNMSVSLLDRGYTTSPDGGRKNIKIGRKTQ